MTMILFFDAQLPRLPCRFFVAKNSNKYESAAVRGSFGSFEDEISVSNGRWSVIFVIFERGGGGLAAIWAALDLHDCAVGVCRCRGSWRHPLQINLPSIYLRSYQGLYSLYGYLCNFFTLPFPFGGPSNQVLVFNFLLRRCCWSCFSYLLLSRVLYLQYLYLLIRIYMFVYVCRYIGILIVIFFTRSFLVVYCLFTY